MMCDRCAALEDELAYLRDRLADRLSADLLRVLYKTFGLPTSEAKLVAALFQARGVVPYADLERRLITDHVEEYADPNTAHVFVYRIRKRLGVDFVDTVRTQGFALSDRARLAIANAINADTEARTATDIVVRHFAPHWTDEIVQQLQDIRRQGLSYAECAARFGVTRGAVAGAIHRHLRIAEAAQAS